MTDKKNIQSANNTGKHKPADPLAKETAGLTTPKLKNSTPPVLRPVEESTAEGSEVSAAASTGANLPAQTGALADKELPHQKSDLKPSEIVEPEQEPLEREKTERDAAEEKIEDKEDEVPLPEVYTKGEPLPDEDSQLVS